MKKVFLLFTLIILAVQGYSQTNLIPGMFGQKLQFYVQWSGPIGGGHSIPRTPVCPPSVYMDGRTLYFESDHPAFTVVLVDTDGNEACTLTVPSNQESVTLPSDLTGDYELQLYSGGSYYFYCDILL